MSIEKNRALLKGLLLACPFELPLHDCHLGYMRMLSKEARIAVADAMEPYEIEEHLLAHRNCLMERRKTRSLAHEAAPAFAGEQRI